MWILGIALSAFAAWLFGYFTGSSVDRGMLATIQELPDGEYELISVPVFHRGNCVAVCRHENQTLYSVCHRESLPQRWRRAYNFIRGYYPLPLEEITPRKRTIVPS